MVMSGIGLGPINPIIGTVLQERIPVEMRGRVFGGVIASALVAAPLGMLAIGTVIGQFGADNSIFAMAAVLAVTAIGLWFASPLRAIDQRL